MAKGAYIGVSYTPLSPTFSDNTWDQIVYACRNNCVPDTWAVGNQKSMMIGGADYLIDIIGKNHDDYADDSGKAPLTFLMHGVFAEKYAYNTTNSNSSGWTNSVMRKTHMPSILEKMPKEVQNGIKEVKKLSAGGTSSSASIVTSDKLFLLAEVEIKGYASDSASGEGTQYAYFANGNSPEKYSPDGTRQSWWLRSSYKSSQTNFMVAWMKNSFGATPAADTASVAVAFCFGGNSGPSSEARKIKKGYVGVDGKARKIKKAYIGIGGLARPCWSGGELAYYGTITKMAEARWMLVATSNANYAFFGGGRQSTASGRATVDVYDKNLTRQTKSLGEGRFSPTATSVGDYALFGGGQSSSSSYKSSVEAFDLSLSRKNASDLNASASLLAATNIGSYALFAGGQNSNGWRLQITAYNSSLTKSTPNSNLSIARSRLGATSIGEYALFGGGQSNASGLAAMRTEVDAYDKSLTKTTPTALKEGRYHVAASAVGDYALFAGGDKSGGTGSAVVDAYNKSLTRTTPATLSQGRYLLASTSVGDYALFGGGRTGSMGSNVVSVDVYDASLTKTVYESLSAGRYELSATTIGNYALFGGGYADAGMSDAVDAFTVA